MNYVCFSDVIEFDATFKTNEYRMPYVVFVGVKHHYNNIFFRCALILYQSEKGYVWLLERFLGCMRRKTPGAIIAYGNKAMRLAIWRVFPNAKQHLCSWHLQGNCKGI